MTFVFQQLISPISKPKKELTNFLPYGILLSKERRFCTTGYLLVLSGLLASFFMSTRSYRYIFPFPVQFTTRQPE